jgi:transcriptional regulator with XRE-family HTH domain
MDDDSVPTLDEVIGRAVRALREQKSLRDPKEMSQNALALACREKGLRWSRSSIAMLEAGRRSCSISELLIVASALDAPLRLIVSGECLPDRPDTVMLTTTTAAYLAAISEALVGRGYRLGEDTADKIGREIGYRENNVPLHLARIRIESGDADQKAARGLGISIEQLMSVAESEWGRSLTAERERRVDSVLSFEEDEDDSFVTDDQRLAASPGAQHAASPGTQHGAIRALRGRITRELLKELRRALDRPEED